MRVLHIRGIDDETYKLLWNLRRYYKARSWADLIRKICMEYKEEITQYEWL
jgi:hypothetical protein